MKRTHVGKGECTLFSVILPLAEGVDPWTVRAEADRIYGEKNKPFSPDSVHGTWSAAVGIDGRPQLIFSGYILKSMPLFSEREKAVEVLTGIVEHVAPHVPLSFDSFYHISVMFEKQHYHLDYH